MDTKVKFAELRADMYRELGTHITTKSEDRRFWKTLDVLLRITSFGHCTGLLKRTTTIGRWIAFPEGKDLHDASAEDVLTLIHERRHVRQCARYTTLGMALLYLFVPLPIGLAYFRYKFEMEAFEDERKFAHDNGWTIDPAWFLSNLCGAAYLWAWPRKWVKLSPTS
jgi:hypothetical protein